MPDVNPPASGHTYLRLREVLAADEPEPPSGPLVPVRPAGAEIRAALADPTRVLGDYLLLAAVGQGGMGVVWKAWDRALERTVAIKFLRHAASPRPFDQERFLREARLLARLSHPHIVRVLGLGVRDGAPYVVMEWVGPESLLDRLRAGPCPPAEAVPLLLDIADALAYAHRQGILHRDVKPSNILLEPGGAGAARPGPKLIDFGLARDIFTAVGVLTEAGLGTPAYAAPEQARGDSPRLGPACDVFGLGATLYHVLAGRAPVWEDVPAGPGEARVAATRRSRLVPPRHWVPHLDRRTEAVVLRAMQTRPEDRYPDMPAFSDALKALGAEASPRRAATPRSAGATAGGGSPAARRSWLPGWLRLCLGTAAVAAIAAFAAGQIYAARAAARSAGVAASLREGTARLAEANQVHALADAPLREHLLAEAWHCVDAALAVDARFAPARLLRARIARTRADAGHEEGYGQALTDLEEAARDPDCSAVADGERLKLVLRAYLIRASDPRLLPEPGAALVQAAIERVRAASRRGADVGGTVALQADPIPVLAEAMAAFRRRDAAATLAPLSPPAPVEEGADRHLLRARAHLLLGQAKEGRAALDCAAAAEPFLRVAQQLRLEVHLACADAAKTREVLAPLLAAAPADPMWRYYDALVYLAQGDLPAAIAALDRLRSEHPDDVVILGDLGVARLLAGEPGPARALLEEYARRAPPDLAAHAGYHLACLDAADPAHAGAAGHRGPPPELRLARLLQRRRADDPAGFGADGPDPARPLAHVSFLFTITASGLRGDPLLDPLRQQPDLWAKIEPLLVAPPK